jgi:hypothetical protein
MVKICKRAAAVLSNSGTQFFTVKLLFLIVTFRGAIEKFYNVLADLCFGLNYSLKR